MTALPSAEMLEWFAAECRAWHAGWRRGTPCWPARRKVYAALLAQYDGNAVLDNVTAIKATLDEAEGEAGNDLAGP